MKQSKKFTKALSVICAAQENCHESRWTDLDEFKKAYQAIVEHLEATRTCELFTNDFRSYMDRIFSVATQKNHFFEAFTRFFYSEENARRMLGK